MQAKINNVYSIVEGSFTADEVARLISELQTLQALKEQEEWNEDTFGY